MQQQSILRTMIAPNAKIHPSAFVDEGATIGENSAVWHGCHVMSGALVGKRCILGQNVFVGGRAVIGDGCRIQNNVSLYDRVVLHEEVFCGPSMVFTNVINPRAFIERKHEYRETVVDRGATLGANSTILCGHRIGEYAMVGAGAVVTHDVTAYALVVGVPARQIGWVCRCGVTLAEVEGEGRTCDACGSRYRLTESGGFLVALHGGDR